MQAESPVITVNRFSQVWENKDPNSLEAEFVSISKETNRKPDTYPFLVKNGVLIDPNTNQPVLKFIAEGTEKNVARKLEKWADKNQEGMALWVSPDKEDLYPCPKIIIHQIAYTPEGQKVVLNTAIIFNTDDGIINPEFKRGALYTFPDSSENITKILRFIKRKSGKSTDLNQNNESTSEKAKYFANKIRSGVPRQVVIQEMIVTGFVGASPISCPRGMRMTFSNFMQENSFNINFSKNERWSYKKGKCIDPDHTENEEDPECHYVGPCNICKKCERRYN